jgi:hypothetical protein
MGVLTSRSGVHRYILRSTRSAEPRCGFLRKWRGLHHVALGHLAQIARSPSVAAIKPYWELRPGLRWQADINPCEFYHFPFAFTPLI